MNGKLLTAMCAVWCAAAVLAAPAPATADAAHNIKRSLVSPKCPTGTIRKYGLCVMHPSYEYYDAPPEPKPDTPKRERAKRMVGMVPHGYPCPGGSIRLRNWECVRMAMPPPEDRDYYSLY